MPTADAPVVDALQARLEPRLAAVRGGGAPPAALLDLAVRRVALPGGDVVLVRPRDWPALLDAERAAGHEPPFWAVTWPAGEALARVVAGHRLDGRRVLDLGCGLGLASVVAARAGADVLAVDVSGDGVTFAAENFALNGIVADAAVSSWTDAALAETGPFDLVLGGDVLYSRPAATALLDALGALLAGGGQAWFTDPGRATADAFMEAARAEYAVRTERLDGGVRLHRLRPAA
jgi:predicted nicotinamide N-methyase